MTVRSINTRTVQLRQTLDWSHQASQDACRILDQYCSQLTELERLAQPVVTKTQALIQTRDNIKQARAQAEEVLDHLDASRKVLITNIWHAVWIAAQSNTGLLSGRAPNLARASCRLARICCSIQQA